MSPGHTLADRMVLTEVILKLAGLEQCLEGISEGIHELVAGYTARCCERADLR